MSSSAHVTLLPRLLRWEPPADRTGFAAGLHAGSAVGVAFALREDLRTPDVRRSLAASVPAAVAGLVLQDVVERRLGTTRAITAGLALGGAALLWADRRAGHESEDRRSAGPADLVAAALAQVVALAPGVSRHGAVLTALRARGLERATAARTSLLLSVPVTLGAAGLTAVRARGLPPLGPALTAGATAYVAARRARWSASAVNVSVGVRMGTAAMAAIQDRRCR